MYEIIFTITGPRHRALDHRLAEGHKLSNKTVTLGVSKNEKNATANISTSFVLFNEMTFFFTLALIISKLKPGSRDVSLG